MNGKIEAKDREDGKNGVNISVYFPKQKQSTNYNPDSTYLDNPSLKENYEVEEEFEVDLQKKSANKRYAVMIIDDNTEILEFLTKILTNDFFVISNSSSEKALHILQKSNIDVIISDVMMEQMNGFDLCIKIKSDFNTSHIPVILLTAKTDTESKIKGLESGADAYIEKPFSPFHLKAQIRNLLKKKEQLQKVYASTPLSELHIAVQNKLDKDFMSKCEKIILERIEDPDFSINTLANELGVSRTSIFTKIKGIIGMTPNEFIKITRLKKASVMMIEGEHRITEVGFLVGFNSSSYFAKCFQKQFGMLPTEFLKNIKDNPSNLTRL